MVKPLPSRDEIAPDTLLRLRLRRLGVSPEVLMRPCRLRRQRAPGSPISDEARRVNRMKQPVVLVGCWPRRMNAELAAAYCGEPSAKAFLKRVGSEYPRPRVSDKGRRLWLRDDLDQAILPPDLQRVRDVAEDL